MTRRYAHHVRGARPALGGSSTYRAFIKDPATIRQFIKDSRSKVHRACRSSQVLRESARLDQAVQAIAGIAEARHDVTKFIEVVVDGAQHDRHLAAVEKALAGREVTIVLGAVDDHLNELGYIVPGLGDAGDRLYGLV